VFGCHRQATVTNTRTNSAPRNGGFIERDDVYMSSMTVREKSGFDWHWLKLICLPLTPKGKQLAGRSVTPSERD
jgi:hypothetical protein